MFDNSEVVCVAHRHECGAENQAKWNGDDDIHLKQIEAVCCGGHLEPPVWNSYISKLGAIWLRNILNFWTSCAEYQTFKPPVLGQHTQKPNNKQSKIRLGLLPAPLTSGDGSWMGALPSSVVFSSLSPRMTLRCWAMTLCCSMLQWFSMDMMTGYSDTWTGGEEEEEEVRGRSEVVREFEIWRWRASS